MEISEIKKQNVDGKKLSFINKSLSSKEYNEIINDNYYIIFDIINVPLINYYGRRVWEKVYLKQTQSSSLSNISKIKLKMTLSETLNFLYEVTPPILRNKLMDNINDIDDILTLLTEYLFITNTEYNKSLFYQFTHLTNLDTKFNVNDKLLNFMIDKFNKSFIILQNYSCEYSEIYNNKFDDKCIIQMVLYIKNNDMSIINNIDDLIIINKKEYKDGIALIIHIDVESNIDEDIHKLIKSTYDFINNI